MKFFALAIGFIFGQAVAEGALGEGWVILCGVHPEAPGSWRRDMTFSTIASAANDDAGILLDASLHGTQLPHFWTLIKQPAGLSGERLFQPTGIALITSCSL